MKVIRSRSLLSNIKKIVTNLSSLYGLIMITLMSNVAYADYALNMSPGVSQISQKIYHLHMTIFWICVAIGVVVFGVLIYSLIMHRKSIGHKAHDFHENTAVEIIWTIIPFVILISMAIPATTVLKYIDDKSNSDILVKVTGYQWRWHYEYPDQDINFYSNLLTPQEQIENKDTKDVHYLRDVDNYLVLPVGKKIRFLFTANDVIHSWWVPELGIKKDTVPGFINESWVIIDKPGIYRGQCAELCGARHAYMPIVVDARSEVDYQKWIAEQLVKKQTAVPNAHEAAAAAAMQAIEDEEKARTQVPTATAPIVDEIKADPEAANTDVKMPSSVNTENADKEVKTDKADKVKAEVRAEALTDDKNKSKADSKAKK